MKANVVGTNRNRGWS